MIRGIKCYGCRTVRIVQHRLLQLVWQHTSADMQSSTRFGYAPLNIRSALVPVANFGSTIAWPLIVLGLFISGNSSSLLIQIGILAFSLSVLFQIVTLPVEFNASGRAIRILGESGMLYPDEISGTKRVLGAAALTYVASAASAILQLIRIILITGGRGNGENDR